MAAASPPNNDIPDDDELDAILNGTLNGQDIFDVSNTELQTLPLARQRPAEEDSGLGIDEEIKVVKKRQPIPKLDDNRLLSDPGIPRLRRISKERLKLKGKGHEYGDIARMLNMYQFWLDELYPRAKFADGLAIIEKLGHSKRVQMMRKEWIDEGKPRHNAREDDEVEDIGADEPAQQDNGPMEGVQSDVAPSVEDDARQDDASRPKGSSAHSIEQPDEDELDALLAGDAAPVPAPTVAATNATTTAEDDPFADAMEAMEGMEGMW
ncbi:chromosome segregation in meiosis- protein [Didymosphaeria variabile]|uniref:Chromosome segregation in meiosis protein n=1 Tax=Didymosphaeria variabile TaxID=1932322 RepID=A0A9W8XHD3_9PLEO|nr:chromosome segregation in meiosis- protein [Didymosphaeria variabile]KAJ4349709.1 chromosome segregation in meiosis- protein [Didymosphaeria variabile]